MTDLIDLRTTSGPGAGSEPPDRDAPEEAPAPTDAGSGRRLGRLVVLGLVGAIVALIVADMVVGAVVHAERQRHLSAEFAEPSADLSTGDAAMLLQIPSIEFNEVVALGTDQGTLRGGPGQREGTPAPGGGGNTVILGHSQRFAGPFAQLEDVAAGDQIAVRTRTGEMYSYTVTKVRTLADDDTAVLDQSGPDRLTVVTSASGPLDGRRVVVTAAIDRTGASEERDVGEDADSADDAGDSLEGEPAAEEPSDEADSADVTDWTFDQRSWSSLLLLLTGAVVVAGATVAAVDLRRRYQPGTVVMVAGPALALGLVLVLFNLDGFIPTTF